MKKIWFLGLLAITLSISVEAQLSAQDFDSKNSWGIGVMAITGLGQDINGKDILFVSPFGLYKSKTGIFVSIGFIDTDWTKKNTGTFFRRGTSIGAAAPELVGEALSGSLGFSRPRILSLHKESIFFGFETEGFVLFVADGGGDFVQINGTPSVNFFLHKFFFGAGYSLALQKNRIMENSSNEVGGNLNKPIHGLAVNIGLSGEYRKILLRAQLYQGQSFFNLSFHQSFE